MAEARNLIVTQKGGTVSSGGIASTTANPVGGSSGAGGMTAAQAQAQAAQQIGDMTRASRLIVTQQSYQSAAQAAALAAAPSVSVTDGLTTLGSANPGLTPDSGLIISQQPVANPSLAPGTTTTYDTPGSWTGINGLSQTTGTTGSTTVSISQDTTTAVLNWATFNVGKNTTLQFNQSDPSWIAFNKVAPSISPSQILGAITAPGQVYIVNANGIVFGGACQVNVHNLTASSLPINDTLVSQGLLNNPNLLFLFSAVDPDTQYQLPASGIVGNIVVEPGAVLSAPTNADNVGGRIALIGPNVDNQGSILTPDGQTILAAGLEVGFLASTDPSVRGLDTYVGQITSPGIQTMGGSGNVTNEGTISAPRGNITLTGAAIDQNGVVSATTSVAENGSIDLLAVYNDAAILNTTPYFSYGTTGSVTFEPDSLTEILPEYDDPSTIAGQIVGTNPVAVPVLALPSQILVQAATINIKGGTTDTAAEILAPNATVSLQAGTPDVSGVDTLDFSDDTVNSVQVGENAIIDVAGSSDVAASVADNIIAVQLLGAELADSPLQRDGPLEGQTVDIDIGQTGTNADGTTWIGTPLADTLGYVNEVQYNVGELTTAGGSITINSGGAVTLSQGSVLNVSGGYINYAGAEVATTHLLTSSGQIVDISQASPDTLYQGIYTGSFTTTDSNLGVSNTFSNPLESGEYYEAGYVKGGQGGSVSIQAPSMSLNGSLAGNTVIGSHQLASSLLPGASSLNLTVGKTADGSPTASPGMNIFFQADGSPAPVAPTGFGSLSNLVLSTDLINDDGFGNVDIENSEGSVTVASGANIIDQPKGSITFDASEITVDADITAPGGSLDFTAHQVSAFNPVINGVPVVPTIDPNKGLFTLGAGDTLNTAGEIIDNRTDSLTAGTEPDVTSGGSITIDSYSADLDGGILNVSGGMIVNADSSLNFAGSNAGKINIGAGQDPSAQYLSVLGGTLNLTNTVLEGYSAETGGSLTIKAPGVQIGGATPANSNTLWIQSDFFNQGGFSSFTLEGIGILGQQAIPAVLIAAGTQINPEGESWQGGFDLEGDPILTAILLPDAQRGPVSLTFDALGVDDSFATSPTSLIRGDMMMEEGASIGTSSDPLEDLSQVAFSGDTATILGTVYAPGGSIHVSGETDQTALVAGGLGVSNTVDLGPSSVLSVAGAVQNVRDKYGDLIGPVLNGGVITLTGDILAEGAGSGGPGALLDVSGTSGVLDLPPADSGQTYSTSIITQNSNFVISTLVQSNAGTITISNGLLPMVMDATLKGDSGGASAQGGSLVISSEVQTNQPLPSDVSLIITPTETAPVDAGISQFAASDFNGKGFDFLTLGGNVEFSDGNTILAAGASLTIGSGGFITVDSGSTATLEAPYVMLGQAFQTPTAVTPVNVFTLKGQTTPYYLAPVSGTGVLNVDASDLIDIGNLCLQDVDVANLTSTNDIRGDGTLDLAGTANLTAGQIYAPTATAFSIIAYDSSSGPGTVNIATNGNHRDLPYAAGSTLTVLASEINQDGVLNAPFGIINLGWNGTGSAPLAIDPIAGTSGTSLPITDSLTLGAGSVTSVSGVDPITESALTVPYGVLLNGSWIDPTGNDITLTGPPAKAVNLSGISVTDSSGALVDVQGGGDLYAYQFVSGTGGSADFLAPSTATYTQTSFAVLPGYQPDYAPYGAYNSDPSVADNFVTTVDDGGNGSVTQATDRGYTDSTLKVGDQVYLGGNGLAAGYYTLLPARYALLPGAFLVTPESSSATTNGATILQASGSDLVSGYRYDGLDQTGGSTHLFTTFQIDPSSVVNQTAQYDNFYANAFFTGAAASNGLVVPRLPEDSGQLVFDATTSLDLVPGAAVLSEPIDSTGLGGLVDIATSDDIFIYGADQSDQIVAGDLNLSVDELNSFGASSLLIGGIRQTSTDGTSVTITTSNIEVDNAGDPLVGPEIILVTAPVDSSSPSNLTLDPGAEVRQQGTLAGTAAETLLIGNAAIPGSGNGNVLWVTSNPNASVQRFGVTDQTPAPVLDIMADAVVSAVTPILDSTGQTLLDPTAVLQGQNTGLGGSQITLWLSGDMPTYTGLLLTADQLAALTSGGGLSLSSQSSIDIYGTGTIGNVATLDHLTLQAAEIRGFESADGVVSGGDDVTFAAQTITLDNLPNGSAPVAVPGIAPSGTLEFDANAIQLGSNALSITQYGNVVLEASKNVLIQGLGNSTPGSLSTPGNLTITTPLITASPVTETTANTSSEAANVSATQSISAGGTLVLQSTDGVTTTTTTAGLGASLDLSGASVTDNTNIQLPSGSVTMEAVNGDVQIGNISSALIDVGGVQQIFNDLPVYTNAGSVNLISDLGNVVLADSGTISVSANPGGGNAGFLNVEAGAGQFTAAGTLEGKGGASVDGQAGQNGSVSIDVGSLAPDASGAPTLTSLEASLGDFTQSFDLRVRSGNIEVAGLLKANSVTLSADNGNITVDSAATIDSSYDTNANFASNPAIATGGSIYLTASGDVTINGTLTVEGTAFNDAGEGGSITLESGTSQVVDGNVVAGTGQINIASGSILDLGVTDNTATSAAAGDFTGTLTLIAPQLDANGNPIAAGNPNDITPVGIAISSIEGTILGSPSSIAIVGNQLYQPANGTIDSTVENEIQANGDAFLGAAGTTTTNYTSMFNGLLGGQSAAIQSVANIEIGAEIVNPTGNLTLGTTTSGTSSDWNLAEDRFGPNGSAGILTLRAAEDITLYNSISDGFDPSSSANPNDETLLAANPLLPANNQSWSYRMAAGADVGAADINQVLSRASLTALNPTYNPAKTGPQGSLQLGKPNPGGTISNIDSFYQVIRTGSGSIDIATGGSVQLLNPFASIFTVGTQAPAVADFTVPVYNGNGLVGTDAQYSYAGGNVSILAQDNIEHVTQNFIGQSPDTQYELPINWLERSGIAGSTTDTTSWWVDFSNFFEGIGALGGGNVSLIADNNITNVDAVIPTDARLPMGSSTASSLVELGGGDLFVEAGNNIDGSVFYVERGEGTLTAGDSVTTNTKRLASGQFGAPLPVTLFLGDGSFNITAGASINLGPVANPFLLPENLDNGTQNETFFSTYGPNDAVNVSSLAGTITLNESTIGNSFLDAYLTYVDTPDVQGSIAASQPWLTLTENSTTIGNYEVATSVMPSTLNVTALASDIDIIGDLTLFPSPTGTIDLAASGSINGLQPLQGTDTWTSSIINLSDANPASFPSVISPVNVSDPSLNGLDNLLDETGSTEGNAQLKESLHTPGGLHSHDDNPLRLYAAGDISGLTLYSGKLSRVIAGNDITDVSLYLQNLNTSDISIVASGQDILPYDPNSPLQTEATAVDAQQQNYLVQAGDIQISGPGTLEVLAGRNITLGDGPDSGDGTGLGITSIGNQRNPYLPNSPGADIVSGAGIGVSTALTNDGLANSAVDFTDPVNHTGFIDQFLNPTYGGTEATTYLPDLASALGLASGTSTQVIWNTFSALPLQQQDVLALNIFYQVLSDSGIAHNDPSSPSFGSYATGMAAIAALFPGQAWSGDLSLSSREIKTENGGSIDLFVPGGSLSLGSDVTKPSADQGILTDEGGAINIYTSSDVDLGASRIFTLRGGNVTIWSALGNIDAGASSKTVQAAPPTRVIVDPQTGNVETDLAGLATGGGIGVLESKASVVPSNVNLIAPVGTVNAGDAGIRVSGNLNIAALHIINAGNISVGGSSSGVPTGATINVAGLLGASNTAAASNQAAQQLANVGAASNITVQVIGYGGDDDDSADISAPTKNSLVAGK